MDDISALKVTQRAPFLLQSCRVIEKKITGLGSSSHQTPNLCCLDLGLARLQNCEKKKNASAYKLFSMHRIFVIATRMG